MDTLNREFNLLDEKWIRVMNRDYSVQEVSLIDVFENAHQYVGLAGELLEQDMTMLRFLLAVVYTVFWRYDENGDPSEIEDERTALERWKTLWNMQQFPAEPVKNYLNSQRNKFWLFDDERPFWQVKAAVKGTKCSASKLIGEVFESNNKTRFFSSRMGKSKKYLEYSEAARWLLFINGFDDCAAKKPIGPDGKKTSPLHTYLSRLGLIAAKGDNLFETLMLNMTFLQNGSELWKEQPNPVWEYLNPREDVKSEIVSPENLAELLTIQSRRILLKQENGMVTGFFDMAGDSMEDILFEQMTLWKKVKDKQKNITKYVPSQHDSSKQMWRNFAVLVAQKEEGQGCTAGIISWISRLKRAGILKKNQKIQFQIVQVQYGSMSSGVENMFEDSLTVYAELLVEKESTLQNLVILELKLCEQIAGELEKFAKNIALSSGADKKTSKNQGVIYKEQFFSSLDIPCRQWIASINPEDDNLDRDDLIKRWRDIVWQVINQITDEIICNMNSAAVSGRYIRKKRYAAPEIYNQFFRKISSIYRM
ncbi:MAG: type I-E CRISPR-associated protein Cse1/CasA [Lachnospiraceae bacterium]